MSIDSDANRLAVKMHFEAHPCVDCGEPDPIVLELTSRHPAGRVPDLQSLVSKLDRPTLGHELEKYDVRCGNCQRVRDVARHGGYHYWMASLFRR